MFDPDAFQEAFAVLGHGVGVLFGGTFGEVLGGFGDIFCRDATTCHVAHPEIAGGAGVSVFPSAVIPLESEEVIGGSAEAFVVEEAEFAHGARVAHASRFFEKREGFRRVVEGGEGAGFLEEGIGEEEFASSVAEVAGAREKLDGAVWIGGEVFSVAGVEHPEFVHALGVAAEGGFREPFFGDEGVGRFRGVAEEEHGTFDIYFGCRFCEGFVDLTDGGRGAGVRALRIEVREKDFEAVASTVIGRVFVFHIEINSDSGRDIFLSFFGLGAFPVLVGHEFFHGF